MVLAEWVADTSNWPSWSQIWFVVIKFNCIWCCYWNIWKMHEQSTWALLFARRNWSDRSIKEPFFLKALIHSMVCQPLVASSVENTALRQSHPPLNFYSKHPPYCVCSLYQSAEESSAFQHRMLQLSFPSWAVQMDGASEPHLVWQLVLHRGFTKARDV